MTHHKSFSFPVQRVDLVFGGDVGTSQESCEYLAQLLRLVL